MDITFFTSNQAPTTFFHSTATAHGRHDLPNSIAMQTSHTSTSSENSGDHSPPPPSPKWAPTLLHDCARAISDKDSTKIHHFLWMLNELASPYGDSDQKLASYFLQAFFCRATETGVNCYKTLISAAEKNNSFDSARRLILKFQEASPWTTFGHVAANGAVLEALEGETKLHIIDISDTLCTQWPTLLESLATRNDIVPHLKLTVVITATMMKPLMKEIGQRMEKFARLMGVPFEFNSITEMTHLGNLSKEELKIEEDEAVAVNCIGALRKVKLDERKSVIEKMKSLKPRILTIVEEEADFVSSRNDFIKSFEECLRFYTIYLNMLEESFQATSNERLQLERESSREIVRFLGCDENGVGGERERGKQWSERLKEANFSSTKFSDDVTDDVKALLKRYKTGWGLLEQENGVYLTWKEEPVIWVSAWKP